MKDDRPGWGILALLTWLVFLGKCSSDSKHDTQAEEIKHLRGALAAEVDQRETVDKRLLRQLTATP